MPDWLINLVVQYPVAALNGLVVWYVWKQVRGKETATEVRYDEREKRLEARTDGLRKELRDAADNEIRRFLDTMKESQNSHLQSKEAEIARLTNQFMDEMKKLTKKVDELAKKKPD